MALRDETGDPSIHSKGGRSVPYPARIVSLLPSITEILSSLGLAEQIVGITHECDYPPAAIKDAQVVTTSDISPFSMTQAQIHEAVCGSLINGQSLYGLNKEILQSVRPDIVFTQSLCDVCAVSYPVVLATCAKLIAGPPPPTTTTTATEHEEGHPAAVAASSLYPQVISMEPTNLLDVLHTFHVAATALGHPILQERADAITKKLRNGMDTIRRVVGAQSPHKTKPSVAFLEWHAPLFTGGHWIPDMLEIAGAHYTMCRSGERSALMPDEDLIELDPDYILIGPCGFSLDRALADTLTLYEEKSWFRQLRAVREGKVFALDGNSYYARPGPRLLEGTGIMAACIHGEAVATRLEQAHLAPSSGYFRITEDMYGKQATMLLAQAHAAPTQDKIKDM